MSKIIGELKGKLPAAISREEIEKHYITGWQLAKILASIGVALATIYWTVTPKLIDSAISNAANSKINEKLDYIIDLLQYQVPQKPPHKS